MSLVYELVVRGSGAALVDAEEVFLGNIYTRDNDCHFSDEKHISSNVPSGCFSEVHLPGLSGVWLKCCEVKVFPSGYFG